MQIVQPKEQYTAPECGEVLETSYEGLMVSSPTFGKPFPEKEDW